MGRSIWSRTTRPRPPLGTVGVVNRPLSVFNSYLRRVERFEPLTSRRVGIYSCGLTVYSRGHLGNLRAYVFADTLRRTLLWQGYSVDHVINITDVGHLLADADQGDDKVEQAALREQRSVWELTEHYQRLFEEDLRKLDVLPPRVWTKASDYVPRMVEFAMRLQEQGHTYLLPSGLYFDTSTISNYGALATIDHQGLEEGARVEPVAGRRHPTDFALWRTYNVDEPSRAMGWDSPWGRGAPGWHLECSVMAIEQLGPHFDIHTGGVDHREIHHPNEDAQSRAYLGDGQPWVRYWMHNEFVSFGGEKMSKSKGNLLILDDVVERGLHPIAYRLLLLQSHYRSQMRLTMDDISAAHTFLDRLVRPVVARLDELPPALPLSRHADLVGSRYIDALDQALAEDLATPRAVAALNEAIGAGLAVNDLNAVLAASRDLLGLDLRRLAERRRAVEAGYSLALDDARRQEIEALISRRETARRNRDFAAADNMRERLRNDFDVEVVDAQEGSTWSLVGPGGSGAYP